MFVKYSTYRSCSCFTAQVQYGSHFPVTKASSSSSSVLANIVKVMNSIIPGLKYTFGYHADMRKNKPAKPQHRKPPNFQRQTRMLVSWKTELSQKLPSSSRGRPCIRRCTMEHSGAYQMCGSCKQYVICSGGYVSLVSSGWFHVYNTNVYWLNQSRVTSTSQINNAHFA